MNEFSPAECAARLATDIDALRAKLLPQPPSMPLIPAHSDFDLNPGMRPAGLRNLAPAAVLLPIVGRAAPTVLFTLRTEHLPRHAGQVSFPGGRVHDDDRSLIDTALRETQEEIGISAELVSIAGFLDAYETGTGYAILPVVGLLGENFTLNPDHNEVAEVFEVPLAFLLDPANRERDSREWNGRRREYYVFRYERYTIWGATAAILVNFGNRIAL
jgi:8-oxo-dGTP pyrophosphatase MutT (NUDIX family)